MHTLEYRCPGEAHPITPAVHLGRLTSFYHACRHCPHRHGLGTTSRRRAQRLAEAFDRAGTESIFDSEGVAADYLNQFTPSDARRLGRALGDRLRQHDDSDNATVLLGSDGGSFTPEIMAAFSEGLRWSGTTASEMGATTAPALVACQQASAAAGAVYVACRAAPRHRIIIRMWQRDGRPLSRPGGLDAVCTAYAAVNRPQRRYAGRRRCPGDPEYLAHLRTSFHALRPLTFLASCDCRPLVGQLNDLLSRVGCTMFLRPERPSPASSSVEQQIRAAGAHFAVAFEQHGEVLRVWDEQGRMLTPVQLASLLVSVAGSGEPSVPVPRPITQQVSSREAAFLSMHASAALVQVFDDYRCWLNFNGPVRADGLQAFAWLLVALSHNDQSLSRRIADLA
jgi:phosphomannomutase